ncbi:MarC family protein [Maridesulfovibrio ferrireducens]|uniref:MarC family protein n=1 Tax=Maridesulfovibrio ferrireducens TaxID=246191 RepID=UPI001A2E4AB1|nr:MarC family protein [Maridesulfovibrio ferrireducens]MBI9112064.1 MarC family protein [Maridesulfovibrio ferrireducens]
MLAVFFQTYLKLFFILTPFFAISAFLSLTQDLSPAERKKTAVKVTLAVIISSLVVYLYGRYIFELFGITLDAFRIGAGAILFLSAMNMVGGGGKKFEAGNDDDDIAVVPLAIPIVVGPGTIGALLVMGSTVQGLKDQALACAALLSAVLTVGVLLFVSSGLKRLLGKRGLNILSRLTGLLVASIAAQIFFTGLRNFMLN